MKKEEKLNYLKENHTREWLSTRGQVFTELSDQQSIFCCCGKLATGLHEYHCRKFNSKVDSETIKKLKHLLKNGNNSKRL